MKKDIMGAELKRVLTIEQINKLNNDVRLAIAYLANPMFVLERFNVTLSEEARARLERLYKLAKSRRNQGLRLAAKIRKELGVDPRKPAALDKALRNRHGVSLEEIKDGRGGSNRSDVISLVKQYLDVNKPRSMVTPASTLKKLISGEISIPYIRAIRFGKN